MKITDSFSDSRVAGKTIGTKSPSGIMRKGIDRENAIAIDNDALRFDPLIIPGWGRQGIAYGAYPRTNGLALAVLIANGHNTSQVETIEWLNERLKRWLKGSETESFWQRIPRWLKSRQKKGTTRRLLWWLRIAPGVTKLFPLPNLDENLAVGWFPQEVPTDPLKEGNGFIVHATGAENGELWTRVGNNLLPVIRGLQNLQLYYVIILRERGAAYYAASVPHASGLGIYPNLRPLAIDPFNQEATVYAGIYQSALGQIGFRSHTRVSGVQVEQIPDLATWYGTAHLADRFIGNANLAEHQAEVGGLWQIQTGSYQLSPQGLIATGINNLAILNSQTACGLIHLLIETITDLTECGLVFRYQDRDNYWSFLLSSDRCKLELKENSKTIVVAETTEQFLAAKTIHSVQILDDGECFGLSLNGQLVFKQRFKDTRLQTATEIGIVATESNPQLYFRDFEAHPASLPLPNLLDLGSPWWSEGKQIVVQDHFAAEITESTDLAGKITKTGDKIWRKATGAGVIEIIGNNQAKVKGDRNNPNPGRTAYTIDWDYPNLADLEVEIIPPGKQRGQGEKGRAGLIFWQDADNYIIVNTWLDDYYEGESISSFFRIDGFEEIFDAVWTNIGQSVTFGKPYTLRTIFDGNNYLVRVNNQSVLYRALTDVYPDLKPLSINQVGIVANWEWGNDTGSAFQNFVARI
jgi:hypothetical protein